MTIPCFFHKEQLLFKPKYEWVLGARIKHPETTKRAESILGSLKASPELFQIISPESVPLGIIKQTHSPELLEVYETAQRLEGRDTFYPCVFPQRMTKHPNPKNIFHAGYYCIDSGTPLNNQTWKAACWSASAAYDAADTVLKGEANLTFALSRPPGHHASKDTYGGYCYLNNAAIAAKHLKKKGKVAIIDIDFHHGNGTQEIFYSDDNVLFISLHGDPDVNFPYFCGYTTEIGKGKGEGYNHNIILPERCSVEKYISVLKSCVIPLVKSFNPSSMVISAGFDTYKEDPIGRFALDTEDYTKLGALFAKSKIPTVVCQEGGYYTQALGENAVCFLKGFL